MRHTQTARILLAGSLLAGLTACGTGADEAPVTPAGQPTQQATPTGMPTIEPTVEPSDSGSTPAPTTTGTVTATGPSTTTDPASTATVTNPDPRPMSYEVTWRASGGIDGRENELTITPEGTAEFTSRRDEHYVCAVDPGRLEQIQQAAREARVDKDFVPDHTAQPMPDQIMETISWGSYLADPDNAGVKDLSALVEPLFRHFDSLTPADADPCRAPGLTAP